MKALFGKSLDRALKRSSKYFPSRVLGSVSCVGPGEKAIHAEYLSKTKIKVCLEQNDIGHLVGSHGAVWPGIARGGVGR